MQDFGKYLIHEELGRGAFGSVYKATDKVLDRFVALKILHEYWMLDNAFIDNFLTEARAMAKLQSMYTAQVYEADQNAGKVFLAMRYYPGGNLRKMINSTGPLLLEDALRIMGEISIGLNEAHNMSMVHRDIKPENILFDKDGRAVVGDFGLTKVVGEVTSSFSQGGVGTPNYKAPELWHGTPEVTPATDIYSLGCVLAEMLCGHQIFPGEPTIAMTKHLITGPDLPEGWDLGMDDPIMKVLAKCLNKEMEKRYQSTPELMLDLELDQIEEDDRPGGDITLPPPPAEARTLKVDIKPNHISAGGYHTVGMNGDGKILSVGDDHHGQLQCSEWKEIISISCGSMHSLGIRKDGKVVVAGYRGPWSDVYHWDDIVKVAGGGGHSVGLISDGRVIVSGGNNYGENATETWSNIVNIAAGISHTVGLRNDGTVVAVGDNKAGQTNVMGWKDIVSIAAGSRSTIGIKSDGTVVVTGDVNYAQRTIGNWSNIIMVAGGYNHVLGLRKDGTVLAAGGNDNGQCDTRDWNGIVAIAAGNWHSVGLRSDGKVVACGYNESKQTNVSDWYIHSI